MTEQEMLERAQENAMLRKAKALSEQRRQRESAARAAPPAPALGEAVGLLPGPGEALSTAADFWGSAADALTAPVNRALTAYQGKVRGLADTLAPRLGPTGELLTRQALAPFGAGQEQVEQMDPRRKLQAVNALEGRLGTTGSALAQGLAEFGPMGVLTAPVQLLKAPRAVAGLAGIARTAGVSTLEGGLQGAAQNVLSAPEGQRLQALAEGGLGGALIGGTVGAAAGAGREGLSAVRRAALGPTLSDEAALGRRILGALDSVPEEVTRADKTQTRVAPEEKSVVTRVDDREPTQLSAPLTHEQNAARVMALADEYLARPRGKAPAPGKTPAKVSPDSTNAATPSAKEAASDNTSAATPKAKMTEAPLPRPLWQFEQEAARRAASHDDPTRAATITRSRYTDAGVQELTDPAGRFTDRTNGATGLSEVTTPRTAVTARTDMGMHLTEPTIPGGRLRSDFEPTTVGGFPLGIQRPGDVTASAVRPSEESGVFRLEQALSRADEESGAYRLERQLAQADESSGVSTSRTTPSVTATPPAPVALVPEATSVSRPSATTPGKRPASGEPLPAQPMVARPPELPPAPVGPLVTEAHVKAGAQEVAGIQVQGSAVGPGYEVVDRRGRVLANLMRPEEAQAVAAAFRQEIADRVAAGFDPLPKGKLSAGVDPEAAKVASVRAQAQAARDPRTVPQPPPMPPEGPRAAVPDAPPGVPVTPRQAAEATPDDIKAAASMWDRLLRQERSPLAEAYKQLVGPEFRKAPEMVTAAIRSWQAQHTMQNLQIARGYRTFEGLLQKLERQRPGTKAQVEAWVEAHRTARKDAELPPIEALPAEVRDLFQQSVRRNMENALEVAKALEGTPTGQAFAAKLLKDLQRGRYWIHREYLARLAGRDYTPPAEVMQKALDFVVEEARANGKPISPEQAVSELWGLLDTPGATPVQRWTTSRLNGEVLKRRTEMPGPLRRLLGELNDGALNLAITNAEGERLARAMRVSGTFTEPRFKGQVWDDQASPGMFITPVPDDPLAFGKFAGKYLHPALWAAVMEAPRPAVRNFVLQGLGSIAKWMGGVNKTAATLLSHNTWASNWISNIVYATAAGLPPWSPSFAPRLVQSARAMAAFGKTLGSSKVPLEVKGPNALKGAISPGEARWMQMALEDGAVRPGQGGEVGGSEAAAIARTILDRGGDHWPLFTALADKARQATGRLGTYYDALDNHWRLATYIHQVEKAVAAGQPLDVARARASAIVNQNFASAGTAPPAVKDASRYTGVFAPFMTFAADNVRVVGGWVKNAHQDPGRTFNLLALHGALAGLAAAARYSSGMTDAEVAGAEASMGFGVKERRPGRIWLPWRDGKGRAWAIDLTNLTPLGMFVKGDPENNLLTRAALNTFHGMVDGGGLEGESKRLLSLVGLEKQQREQRVLPGQGWQKLLEDTWEYHQPGTIRVVKDALRRAEVGQMLQQSQSPLSQLVGQVIGQRRPTEEPYTPEQAALRALTPFYPEPVGNISATGVRQALTAQRTQAKTAIKDAMRGGGLTPAQRPAIIKAAREDLAKVGRTQGQLSLVRQGGR